MSDQQAPTPPGLQRFRHSLNLLLQRSRVTTGPSVRPFTVSITAPSDRQELEQLQGELTALPAGEAKVTDWLALADGFAAAGLFVQARDLFGLLALAFRLNLGVLLAQVGRAGHPGGFHDPTDVLLAHRPERRPAQRAEQLEPVGVIPLAALGVHPGPWLVAGLPLAQVRGQLFLVGGLVARSQGLQFLHDRVEGREPSPRRGDDAALEQPFQGVAHLGWHALPVLVHGLDVAQQRLDEGLAEQDAAQREREAERQREREAERQREERAAEKQRRAAEEREREGELAHLRAQLLGDPYNAALRQDYLAARTPRFVALDRGWFRLGELFRGAGQDSIGRLVAASTGGYFGGLVAGAALCIGLLLLALKPPARAADQGTIIFWLCLGATAVAVVGAIAFMAGHTEEGAGELRDDFNGWVVESVGKMWADLQPKLRDLSLFMGVGGVALIFFFGPIVLIVMLLLGAVLVTACAGIGAVVGAVVAVLIGCALGGLAGFLLGGLVGIVGGLVTGAIRGCVRAFVLRGLGAELGPLPAEVVRDPSDAHQRLLSGAGGRSSWR